MATIDEVYSAINDVKSYFNVDNGVNNTQDNTNSINSFIVMFFRIFLHILYQSLCYVSHLSRNFSERVDYYNLTYNSSKLHVDVDFSTSNYISWFTSSFSTEFFTAEIVDCVHPDDDHLGGRILTDSVSYNSQNGLLEFHFEFEVFCPFLDISLFGGLSSQEKEDIFTLLLKNFFRSGLNTSLLSATTDKLFSKSWTDLFLSKSRPDPSQENWTLLDGASVAALPAVLDTAIDVFDTSVDTVDAVSNRISDWRETIDDSKNTINQIAEQSKLDLLLASQYNPEIFNRNLGNALNFPRNLAILEEDKNYVVQKIDSPNEFISFWEFLADIIDDAILNDNLRWNWDFSCFVQFLDDTGVNKLWLSNELKYINAKFPRA